MNVELRALTPEGLVWLLAGERTPEAPWHPQYPMEETFVAGQLTVAGAAGADPAPWGMYQIVVDGRVVGDAGFHGPLGKEGTVEIGYNVVAEQRGRGIASAACCALVALAWREGAARILAETGSDNVASQRVLVKAGFGPFDPFDPFDNRRERGGELGEHAESSPDHGRGEPRVFWLSQPTAAA